MARDLQTNSNQWEGDELAEFNICTTMAELAGAGAPWDSNVSDCISGLNARSIACEDVLAHLDAVGGTYSRLVKLYASEGGTDTKTP